MRVALADGFDRVERLSAPQRLAYKAQGRLMTWRLDAGEPQLLHDDKKRSLNCAPAWSPDGATLYYSHQQVFAIEAATGAKRPVTRFKRIDRYSVLWYLDCSPDNQQLAFLQFPGSFTIASLFTAGERPAPRLCAIHTDGSDYRVLWQAPPDSQLWGAAMRWAEQQALVKVMAEGGEAVFWRVDTQGGPAVPLGATPDRGPEVALSPDGAQIAEAGAGGLSLFSLAEGTRRQLNAFGEHPAWSPDGTQLAFMNEDGELWRYDLREGRAQRLAWRAEPGATVAERHSSYARPPVWSPDGLRLWFGLTRAARAEPVEEPDFERRVRRVMPEVSAEELERMRQQAREYSQWQYQHVSGVFDFAQNQVWLHDAFWSNVAWSPGS
jgi:Tol biopolymer transport system component